jgi:hypothetical protein
LFEEWFIALDESDRARVEDRVDLLEQLGPALGRPVVDSITASRHHNMKELRTGSLRVLFIFDPASTAVLLLGGDKRDQWKACYEKAIRTADDLYDEYLAETNQPTTDT